MCDIEMQFRRLDIGFRGRQSRRNIDRDQNMFSSALILPIWKHGDHETGSSYNYASVRDRNRISASTYMFSRTPKSIEHRPTSSYARFCLKRILHIRKHVDFETGNGIHAKLYRTWCRSMFHWRWHPWKQITRRRNCSSISYRHIVILLPVSRSPRF